jgi:hypothetical protein
MQLHHGMIDWMAAEGKLSRCLALSIADAAQNAPMHVKADTTRDHAQQCRANASSECAPRQRTDTRSPAAAN